MKRRLIMAIAVPAIGLLGSLIVRGLHARGDHRSADRLDRLVSRVKGRSSKGAASRETADRTRLL